MKKIRNLMKEAAAFTAYVFVIPTTAFIGIMAVLTGFSLAPGLYMLGMLVFLAVYYLYSERALRRYEAEQSKAIELKIRHASLWLPLDCPAGLLTAPKDKVVNFNIDAHVIDRVRLRSNPMGLTQ